MFLSLNRKIVYSVFGLLLLSSLLFIFTFYTAYSSKIEKDQLLSIQRNQQYSDLLYRSINLAKELNQFITAHPDIAISKTDYKHIHALIQDQQQSNFLVTEQKNISERSKSFDEQYKTIYTGITIIAISAILLALLIFLIGYLIGRWILTPINQISHISEQISRGNLNLRIPLSQKKHHDELDNLAQTFNLMLDNLQNIMSEIKDKENFLQALIDSIPDGIRVIDENHNIIIANQSYYKQSGSSALAGLKCYNSSFKNDHPCDTRHTRCPLIEILQQNKQNVNTIQQFSHRPNRHLAINAAPMLYASGRKYIVESIRDLSEDIDFSHQQKLSSLGFLSSSIAHEIKNHLGALRIIMEHLISKYYTDLPEENDQKKMINMIYNELINAVDVPERLLKLTRGYGASETDINCAQSISEVLSLLDFEAKSKGINIEFKPLKKEIYLRGNEADFKIAIINIILNAIKAMPDKGTLTIKISSTKNGLHISFTDTGIGISKENISHIFTPFFSDGHQTKNTKGSGLGLAITKSIIEKLGGTIEVSSTLGKGSSFTFVFPPSKK